MLSQVTLLWCLVFSVYIICVKLMRSSSQVSSLHRTPCRIPSLVQTLISRCSAYLPTAKLKHINWNPAVWFQSLFTAYNILYTNCCIGNGFLHFPWPIYWMQGLQANVVNTVFLAYMLCKCRRPLALKLPFPLSVFVHIWLWTSFMDGLLLFLHTTYEKFV